MDRSYAGFNVFGNAGDLSWINAYVVPLIQSFLPFNHGLHVNASIFIHLVSISNSITSSECRQKTTLPF
jgi:hypothetical protein